MSWADTEARRVRATAEKRKLYKKNCFLSKSETEARRARTTAERKGENF